MALGFLNNSSLGRFDLDEVDLAEFFIFLDEFVAAHEKQSERLSGFSNEKYSETYDLQTKAQSDLNLLSIAIMLFGIDLFNRRGDI